MKKHWLAKVYCVAFAGVVGVALAAPTVGEAPPAVEGVTKWMNLPEKTEWAKDGKVDFDKLKGKVVMIEFWATWCPPCIRSIPHLSELYKEHKDEGFEVVSVTRADRRQNLNRIEGFVKNKKEMNYPIAVVEDAQIYREYGIRGIPNAVLVDRQGKVRWQGNPLNPQIDAELKKLLAEKPAEEN